VVLPDAPLGAVVLEPLLAGAVVLPDVLLWPEVLPEVAPLAASFMHCSFSVPIRCAHLVSLAPAAALPLAPVLVEVLDWPLVLPLPEDEEGVVVCELVLPLADGVFVVCELVLLPLAEDGVVVCELVLPLADGVFVVCALVLPLAEVDGVLCELVLLLPPAAAEPLVEVDGVCALVLPLADGVVVLCALVLPLAEVDGVLCELVLPLAAPRSRRQRSFSAAIMLSQLLAAMPPAAALPDAPPVCAPALPDEVWANEALDSARSAAAVALARTFRFIWMLLWRNDWSELQRGNTQAPCRSSRRRCAERTAACRAGRRLPALVADAAFALRTLQAGTGVRRSALDDRRLRQLGAGADARAGTFGHRWRGAKREQQRDQQARHDRVPAIYVPAKTGAATPRAAAAAWPSRAARARRPLPPRRRSSGCAGGPPGRHR
jgi:hypothetical protein